MAFPWLGSTTLLLLWLCCAAEEAQNGCGPPPRRDREELADLSPKESYAHNEIVLYNCRPGYIKLGRFRMQCKNGHWEQAPPYIECKKKPCGHPGDAQFGSFELVEGDGFYFGARVVYRCDEGYQMLSRTDFRVCRADGWSNEVPHCEITKCFPVKEPENGRIIQTGIMDLDQDFLFGHLLRFDCADRFRIEGADQIVCTAQGTWSAPVPKCVEVTCQPERIDHGRIISGRNIYKDGDRIQFSCDRGYKHADRNEATCTRNGWNARLECIEIVCLSPHVEHGDFRPKDVQYKYEDPIEIVCESGFQSSAPTSRCTEQGWQPPARCIPKNCGYIQIQNGRYYYYEAPTSFPKGLGYRIDYLCNSGFLPPEKGYYGTFRCTRFGWDPEPKCLKKCEHRSPLRNGKFIYSYWNSFIEGDLISYSCNEGYHPANKNASVTCTKDGWSPPPKCVTWQEMLPSCKNVAPRNGFFVNPKAKFSLYEKVAYGCQSGFTTKEGHERGETQCLEDGLSSVSLVSSETCPKPAEENANFPSSKTTYLLNDILSYECKDGFQTVKETSEGQTQCTENGWDPNPVCLPIECEGLALEHGRINKRQDKYVNGEVVQFSCLKKYTRVGPDSAQCYYFGWYPQPPICKGTVKPCVQPNSTIPHGSADGVLHEEYQHGEKVVYECNLGFAMTGSNTIECVDGEWTSLPSCTEEPKTCSQPPHNQNAHPVNVDGNRYKHNETVEYECKGRNAIPGPFIARCLHGNWELPSCNGKCKRPGYANFVPYASTSKLFSHNQTANYSCHSGSYATKCVHGKWSPEPLCPELCPPPPQIPNAVKITEMRNYRSGEEVSFTCMEHFVRKGPRKITCEGGRWQTPPRCVDRRCGDPPPIPHGEANSDASRKYDPGETVEYLCHEGFEIDGSGTATCGNMGWSQLPRCKERSCQKPSPIDNASYINKVKNVYDSGETVHYECHPGFAAEGPQTITCRRGEWSQASTCEDVTCREPPVVENADIVEERAESYQPGHELHYQCHEGFEISGSNTIRCENKEWSTPPRCEDITCPPPPTIQNGRINAESKAKYMPLEKVSYRCLSPYSLFGPATTMCLKKEWTDIPECKVAGGKCDRPPSIDNGDILEMAKFEYSSGEKVHYKCQNLYRMEGTAEVQCYNGHWTQPPTCTVPCTASEEDMKINNIKLRWKGDPKLYSESGDHVEFACRSGYDPDPSSPPFIVRCVDGRFEYPRCIRRA
ncbi:hypothetical protein JRQ81_014560 [Phrynocephalus forsythii]|uniref:Sushi domain-containing protein n=1 Tax=Phrynocephalus forsythii TaxID=171643 RepID=A0A9Q0XYW0_9SAUR|nr:hypothetical protein JRQ81_014560 [Phrynocephalus forsythii]